MGANGNRRQTLRTNIVQPYEAGMLTDVDNKDYNAVVGIELDKISTATKHMFQGLDDVRKEVEDRTKALDALKLTVNDQFNKVMLEISGVKVQIGQGISVNDIYDANGNSLAGSLEGLMTQITTANANIVNILGEITNTNFRFDGEITSIKTDLGVVQQDLGFLYGPEGAQALWTVHQNVQGVTSSVGLVTTIPNNTDPIHSEFFVKADAFNVYTRDGSGSYTTNPMLSVTSNGIFLGDNIYIKGAYVSGDIQSTQFSWDETNRQYSGWKLQPNGEAFFGETAHFSGTLRSPGYVAGDPTGWEILPTGLARFNNIIVRGEVNATSGTFNNVTINENCTVLGKIYAKQIEGDIYASQADSFERIPTGGKSVNASGDYTLLTIAGADFDRTLDSNMIVVVGAGNREFFRIKVDGVLLDDDLFYYDTGNNGENGTGMFVIQNITLPTVGIGNTNTISLNVQEGGRGGNCGITTPFIFSFRPGISTSNSINNLTSPFNASNFKDTFEVPYVRAYRKVNTLVTGHMTA